MLLTSYQQLRSFRPGIAGSGPTWEAPLHGHPLRSSSAWSCISFLCVMVDHLDLERLIYQRHPFPDFLASRMTVQAVGQGSSSSSRKKLKNKAEVEGNHNNVSPKGKNGCQPHQTREDSDQFLVIHRLFFEIDMRWWPITESCRCSKRTGLAIPSYL